MVLEYTAYAICISRQLNKYKQHRLHNTIVYWYCSFVALYLSQLLLMYVCNVHMHLQELNFIPTPRNIIGRPPYTFSCTVQNGLPDSTIIGKQLIQFEDGQYAPISIVCC